MEKFIIGSMITGMVLLFSVGALALPKDGLILHFAFDGGTANDLSGQGNDGTLNGGATIVGEGLELDGADGWQADIMSGRFVKPEPQEEEAPQDS